MVSAGAVAVFPLAFYSSMRLAGVAVGTVVSIGSAPPAAAVIERIVDHQSLSRVWALGTTVGVSGVLALALAHPDESGPVTTTAAAQPVLGIALGLLAGFTYALYSWGAVRVMRCGLPSRPVMGAVFGLGGILLLPVQTLTGAPIITSGSNLAVAAYLAIVPMFLGYVLFGCGLATVAASTATTVSLLEPAVAALIAVIVLHEHLPPIGWLGLGLLFASLVLTANNTRPTTTSHLAHQPTGAPDRAVPVTISAGVETA
jgi:DME family drug/metabolite transporter